MKCLAFKVQSISATLLTEQFPVSLQLAMNVLWWLVLLYCIYRVCNCCLRTLNIAGIMFWRLGGPGKVLDFFCKRESENPVEKSLNYKLQSLKIAF